MTMRLYTQKFQVWDPLNEERSDAREIEAASARDAAEKYADEDSDGQIDGLYADGGHELYVACPNGEVFGCVVSLVYSLYAGDCKPVPAKVAR